MIKSIELKYDFTDLEPFIDGKTVEIHHKKHHQTYVDNLNALIENSDMEKMNLEEILKNISNITNEKKAGINNNAGGVYMHNVYFDQFSKNPQEINGKLKDKVNDKFGSFEDMISELKDKALKQFGSGWSALISDGETLEIVQIPNQDVAPIIAEGKVPLVVLDVWEHAYYLKYQNLRAKYLDEVVKIIDWGFVSEIYKKM